MDFKILKEKLPQSNLTVVLTGAGISKESGIPTFRGEDGLWKKYNPEELATPWAFQRNPALVWEWYDYRRRIISKAKPNKCHLLIAEFEERFKNVRVITQNVDGLHEAAGSTNVIKLHGNIWKVKCTKCDFRGINREVPLSKIPPECPKCGSIVRPDVVWFGEPLPSDKLTEAMELSQKADLFIVIGTSLMVQPAASLPFLALERGAFVVEVSPEETPLSRKAHLFFQMGAVEFAMKFEEKEG